MLSSQALETGIGLALMMFVIAVAASNLLDLGRRLLNLRSKDLEVALMSFFDEEPDRWRRRAGKAVTRLVGGVGGPDLLQPAAGTATRGGVAVPANELAAWDAFKATSAYRGVKAARQQVRPAYLSAKTFADAVEELVTKNVPLTGPLKERVAAAAGSTLRRRAELEAWFDEAMAGLSGRYQKKSTIWLLLLGTVMAGALNASLPHVAQNLWQDGTTRASVVAAAEGYAAPSASASPGSATQTLQDVAGAADELTQLKLPIGWSTVPADSISDGGWWLLHILGWLLTGVLASLGGPFWFDIFNRLTLARTGKPPKAPEDETSATYALANALPKRATRGLRP